MFRSFLAAVLLLLPAGMSLAAETAAAPAPLKSGIDLQYIDPAIRPQDDFYRFVSGKWLANTEIPPDRARFGAFDQLRDLSEMHLRAIIDGLAAKKHLPEGTEARKIADLYNSFMDQSLAEKRGLKPLHGVLAEIDGLTGTHQIPAVLAHLAALGVNVPVLPGIDQDARDSTRYAVYLSQGGLGLPDRDYYLKDDDAKLKSIRADYLKHVEKMLAMAGLKDAGSAAQSIVDLETGLARIQWTKVENRDPVKTYNKTEIDKLPDVAAAYDWKKYFAASGIGDKVSYVIVRQPSYFTGLGKLIETTPLSVWKPYLEWHLLKSYAPYLGKRFADTEFSFSGKVLRGIPQNRPQWKRGVELVEQSMGEGLGRLYVAKYFPPQYKARMQALVGNLLTAYRQSIETLEWMSPETKKEALVKLSKFTPKIGYPDKWRDYSALQVKRDDLVGNVMRAQRFEYQREIAKLGKPIDRSEWGMTPQTVNAYYNPSMNEIVFPAAILQPPFFNPAADDAVNYGGIGAVIGHEISHGFDDKGSQSDGDGNLRDWWTKQDHEKFARLTQALVAQYSAYSPLPGYPINGELTLGENIADNSGLAVAYKAYRISLNGHPAPVLDGYTGDQRFYMGWAQVWRGKSRDSETIRLIKIDPHSPQMFRGDVPLTNQAPFYTAFDVKPGDKMYLPPDKRVSIW
ncbi:MAG: M13 family peptidase [Betaproteobacteria bacterium]|nr:M13 family peptidase [Betaproteobacteria bacterium]